MQVTDLATLRFDGMIAREWLTTSGNGSYASSSLLGLNTRKYHGLLVAAMSPPVRRMVILSRMEETLVCRGKTYELACNEYPGTVHPRGHELLRAFSHLPFPRWAFQANGFTIQKELRLLTGESTALLSYTLLGSGDPVELEVRPLFALRGIHTLMNQWTAALEAQPVGNRQLRLPATARSPEIFFAHDGHFVPRPCWYLNTLYRRERERGYDHVEDLWLPGVIRFTLSPGQSVHFACSTEPIDLPRVISEAERQYDLAVPAPPTPRPDGDLEALLRAAEQFVVQSRDGKAQAVAAYPWSPPLGRDALIAFTGLFLVTGRFEQGRDLLAELARNLDHGLIPSELSEDGSAYRYLAADTSLWFVHACGQYLRYGGDDSFASSVLLPAICNIIETYRRGTGLGIAIDPDGLLRAGGPGISPTWMDAQINGQMVTPRHGYPVSLNALWYNALKIAAHVCARFNLRDEADELSLVAERVYLAFNRRFWNPQLDCCFDVLGDTGAGNDASIRPNQLLALSLPHPVLDLSRHESVLERVKHDLLTPLGLRTLSPTDGQYAGAYHGPSASRDRALHQGSVFPWLLGPYVSAMVKLRGRGQPVRDEAIAAIRGCLDHLQDAGCGQLCELFDGDSPHRPGGAPASARSVGELLRAYAEDILDLTPGQLGVRPGNRAPSTPESVPDDRVSP